MTNVLAIDTAGPVIGVALLQDRRIVERIERVSRGAEGRLMPWALALAEEVGIVLADLDAIAVSRGPGAFTGVRVGLATAVGLGIALGRPIVPISSLASRAARAGEGSLAMLDARKGRVYAAIFRDGLPVCGPADVPPEEAIRWVQEDGFTATGEGAIVYRDHVLRAGGHLAPDPGHPAVDTLARLGADALSRGEVVDAAAIQPDYIRAPDARPSVRRI